MRIRWAAAVAGTGLLLPGILGASADARHAALPAGNLVKNPGGEFPFGGTFVTANIKPAAWKVDAPTKGDKGVQVVRYGPDNRLIAPDVSKAIGGGRSYLVGGYPSKVATASQTISVGKAAPEIDAGRVKTCLSAFLGGSKNSPSSARIDLKYLDQKEAGLGRLRIGPVTRGARLDAGTMKLRKAEGKVPARTRALLVTFTAISGAGLNYGSADNISVTLTKGTCPK
jgi:hypothetical protein